MIEPSLEHKIGVLKGYLLTENHPAMIRQYVDDIHVVMMVGNDAQPRLDTVSQQRDKGGEDAAERKPAVRPDQPITTSSPTQRAGRKQKLFPELHLADIQMRHNRGDSNVDIGALPEYNVSHQSIINFLERHGTYDPTRARAAKGAPKPVERVEPPPVTRKASPAPVRPLIKPMKRAPFSTDKLQPGDLVDIHDLLSAGKTLDKIAVIFNKQREDKNHVTVEELESFVIQHKNVQITKLESKLAVGAMPDNHVKPTSRNY